MSSPFPGMDPFIEAQEWEDFHIGFNVSMRDNLMQDVTPRYVVRVERRAYREHFPEPDSDKKFTRPDVSITESGQPSHTQPMSSTATIEPVVVTLPMPEEQREAFLFIRDLETMEIVTVIELLSPGNKRTGSDGQREYLKKREEVLISRTNLVELDFLRGGDRLPTNRPLPPADYYALVCKGKRRPRAEAYAWTIRDPLPSIPVPLAPGDDDVLLNLQVAFQNTYERAAYQHTLNYRRQLEPPVQASDEAWLQTIVGNG